MLSSNVRLFAISAFILATATFSANGQVVVEDTNITLVGGSAFSGTSIAGVVQTINSGGISSEIIFDSQVLATPSIPPNLFRTLQGFVTSPDESADWYIAEVGSLFSLNTIGTPDFSPLAVAQPQSSGGGIQFSTVSTFSVAELDDFFLAVATTGEPGFPSFRNVFGWAQIGVDEFGNYEILDNAVAYGTGNIIVGENAFAVPEPSTAALLAFCGLGFLRRSRQSRLAI